MLQVTAPGKGNGNELNCSPDELKRQGSERTLRVFDRRGAKRTILVGSSIHPLKTTVHTEK